MTFTTTLELNLSPGHLEDLLNGCTDVLVTFEADPQVLMEPVETDWPPVMHRQGSVECDPASVVIESAVVEERCRAWGCGGTGLVIDWDSPHIEGDCPTCEGTGTRKKNIISRITGKDLAKLKEECAEYAADWVADNGLEG